MPTLATCRVSLYDELHRRFTYSVVTGHFYYKERTGKFRPGDIAGGLDNNGYVRLKLDYKSYSAHRMAWLYITGSMPSDEIDHANGQQFCNAWHNLREATHMQNCANKKGTSVFKMRTGWYAAFRFKGKRYNKFFTDREQAIAWVAVEKLRVRGEWNRAT